MFWNTEKRQSSLLKDEIIFLHRQLDISRELISTLKDNIDDLKNNIRMANIRLSLLGLSNDEEDRLTDTEKKIISFILHKEDK